MKTMTMQSMQDMGKGMMAGPTAEEMKAMQDKMDKEFADALPPEHRQMHKEMQGHLRKGKMA